MPVKDYYEDSLLVLGFSFLTSIPILLEISCHRKEEKQSMELERDLKAEKYEERVEEI